MKKAFKFGCLGIIAIFLLIIVVAIFAGGDDDKPSTGATTSNSSSKKSTDDGSKKIDASKQKTDSLGLKVGLGEIKIFKDKLQVGINVENTNSSKISFYPDQGSAVIGDMQLDANMFLTDGSISGDIQSGVKKDAVLEFLVPEGKKLDVKSVKEIKLNFGEIYDEKTFDTKEITFTVPVK